MGVKIYSEEHIQSIADAIREKNGLTDTYRVGDMANAILDIPTGSDLMNLISNSSPSNPLELTDDVIKSETTEIPSYMFYNKTIGHISLDLITTVNEYAFYDGSVIDISMPNCKSIGNYAFYKTTRYYDRTVTLDLPKCESIGNQVFYESRVGGLIDLPECLSIGENAFRSCSRITGLNLPKLTTISSQAFNFCTFEFDITLPSIVSIGNNAFNHTRSVNFTIGDTCTNIGTGIFNAGSGVTNLYVLATTPPTLSGRFKGTSGTQGVSNIYVPAESVDAYKAATNWSIYADVIQAIPAA